MEVELRVFNHRGNARLSNVEVENLLFVRQLLAFRSDYFALHVFVVFFKVGTWLD